MNALPPSLHLAQTPTPLCKLARMSDELGVELWIKRDDLTGSEVSGNKVRKLEFLLADAQRAKANVVLTCGGEQSNHARATAAACARLGLACEVFLRTVDPTRPPRLTANNLLAHLVGATIHWISFADWKRRDDIMAARATQLSAHARAPYVIPEGGSNALGSLGYVLAARELADDVRTWDARPTTVFYACGSGGTGAGLATGRAMAWPAWLRLVGVAVCDDRAYFVDKISRLVAEMQSAFGTPGVASDDISVLDGYVGLGYAKATSLELASIAALARAEGVVLDPVYTGKMWHAVRTEVSKAPRQFGERIILWHTGGLMGLAPFADALSEAAQRA